MLRVLRSFGMLAVGALALGSAGCLAAAVVAGAAVTYGVIKHADNESYAEFQAGLDAVWSATLASLRENGYAASPSLAHGATEGAVHLGDAEVHVESQADGTTRVRVRVGTFSTEDHRRRADLILQGVANRVR